MVRYMFRYKTHRKVYNYATPNSNLVLGEKSAGGGDMSYAVCSELEIKL